VDRSAVVLKVEPYGLVVDVGCSFSGLVHVSEVGKSQWVGKPDKASKAARSSSAALKPPPKHFIDDLKALVKVGQQLRVRLLLPPPPQSALAQGGGRLKKSKKQMQKEKKEAAEAAAGSCTEERDRFTFEVSKWVGGEPVDPSFEGYGDDDGEEREEGEAFGVGAANEDDEEEDLSGYLIPGQDEGDDDDDDEEGDVQDEWESRFGMDTEFY